MTGSTHSDDVRAALRRREEIALFDVREEAIFAEAHPLFAASLPLGRIELEILDRVPRSPPDRRLRRWRRAGGAAVARLESLGYQQVTPARRRARRLAPRRRRAVSGRQRAEQGVRRAGRVAAPHAVDLRRRSCKALHRCRRRPRRARRAPLRRVSDDEHSDRRSACRAPSWSTARRRWRRVRRRWSSSTAPGAPAASSARSR